jgi:hypothetical protein
VRTCLLKDTVDLLMPAQLMFGNSDVNASGAGLPLVALRALAMQASIVVGNANSTARGRFCLGGRIVAWARLAKQVQFFI